MKLLTPISTQTNRKGDKLTAQVLTPERFKGSLMEGVVQESKSRGRLNGKSSLAFTLEQLHQGSQLTPVRCWVQSVVNAQGAPDVDEEGRVLKRQNRAIRTGAAAGLGALLRAVFTGAKGTELGAGIALILIETTTDGASVSFASGSQFGLTCERR